MTRRTSVLLALVIAGAPASACSSASSGAPEDAGNDAAKTPPLDAKADVQRTGHDAASDSKVARPDVVTDGGHDTGKGPVDAGLDVAVDAGTDARTVCSGECVPMATAGWSGPALTAIAATSATPACSGDVSTVAFMGTAGLVAPTACTTCSCGPSSGTCGFPTTIAANAATCALTGATTPVTPFDPAVGWTGACDTNDPIAAGKLCSGVDCAQSVQVAPLVVMDDGCSASGGAQPGPVTWSTTAIACEPPTVANTCTGDAGNGLCFPTPDAGAGFVACIFMAGDNACPTGSPYALKQVLYNGVDDTRGCTPCACGSATGSTCASTVSLYSDGACSTLLTTVAVSASGTDCSNVPAGSALGSKSATPATYGAGSCSAGGGMPTGAATPSMPTTFCCLTP